MALCILTLDGNNDPTFEIRGKVLRKICDAYPGYVAPELEEHLFNRRYVKYRKREPKVLWNRCGYEDTVDVCFLSPTTRRARRRHKKERGGNRRVVFLHHNVWKADPFFHDLYSWYTGDLPTYRFTLINKEKANALLYHRCRRDRLKAHPTG